ncbi:MAG: hypothetical protein ACLTPN_04100 [Clostridia bacterium]
MRKITDINKKLIYISYILIIIFIFNIITMPTVKAKEGIGKQIKDAYIDAGKDIDKMIEKASDKTIEEWYNYLFGYYNQNGTKIEGNKDAFLQSASDDDEKKIFKKIISAIEKAYNKQGENSTKPNGTGQSDEELMAYDEYEIEVWLTNNSQHIKNLSEKVRNDWQIKINKLKSDTEEEKVLKKKLQYLLDGVDADKAEEKAQKEAKEEVKAGITGSTIYKYPSKTNTTVSNSEQSLEDMMSDANDFINKGAVNIDQGTLSNFSKTMYNILLAVGVVVAVIIGAIIGLKLMTSSIEEKAEAKKLLVPYVVGCVMVFGGFAIWKLVVTILQSI